MEISVTGRHVAVPERFQRHIEDKLAKVPQLDPAVLRCEVVVTHEANPRQAKEAQRIEITCYAKRSVIRAEASADDEYGALDLAATRLGERLRRQHDKRRVHRGRRVPVSVARATAALSDWSDTSGPDGPGGSAPLDGDPAPLPAHVAALGGDEDCPIELREKVHHSVPMSVDQALREMELVGHDFYLYQDVDTGTPSVVYRRRGWSYGVIQLEVSDDDAAPSNSRTQGVSATA
ncbi:ribosome hibernation-promoting factor, HPF/YfiA family [Allobranchiibius sp. CTAmp26]|uniref:ribosome hibernation-promoting factor, HPF/YfiA family n=1 Tax=Allobranchiibius sp. CTAmp26 TaxID=2815214 RepID=UPI001AA114C5|nr:ribosome-associated translation inhibitor RaiA [Allobranchiibius sp. CTAmp26]MBO1755587.1 ribosome-associated translation inhibitor RaiA [Allobranchiibius sp. CTAmp26]